MRLRPHLSFALLAALLVILWLAGGASRADVIGQVITRSAAWVILIVFILLASRGRALAPLRAAMPVAIFVFLAAALAALHLIPLPPSVWTDLPGRDLLAQAAIVTGQEQPWRPLSISPEATVNALSSLIVPVVALLLVAGLTQAEQWRVATLLLGLVIASSLLGLLQFSGARFDHPLINDNRGMVSASFANRNHFALFAAIGCLLAPAWGFGERQHARWKGLAGLGLLPFFALIILATGSRSGMLLGGLAIALGLLIVHRRIAEQLRRLPPKVAIPLVVAGVGLLVAAIVLSVTLDRAVSLDRALTMATGEDLRAQALPAVLEVTGRYFPFGSGLGAFDPAYRIGEPDALLSVLYFNHAHNDLIEIVLDAGFAGLLLLGAAILWWLWRSIGAWRGGDRSRSILPRLGSAILLLVLIASATDYPARTPMIMAVMVIAAVWLGDAFGETRRPAAPSREAAGQGGRAGRQGIWPGKR